MTVDLVRAGGRELYAVWKRKRNSAIGWRLDHAADPDRDQLWRAFRTGSLWQQRHPTRDALRAALVAAEHDVPFHGGDATGSCDVLVDLRERCGQPLPCARHAP